MRYLLALLIFFVIISNNVYSFCKEKGEHPKTRDVAKLKESTWIASMEFNCLKIEDTMFHHSSNIKKTTLYKISSNYLKGHITVLTLQQNINESPKDEEIISVLIYNYYSHKKNGKEIPPVYLEFSKWVGKKNCKKFDNMEFDIFNAIGVD